MSDTHARVPALLSVVAPVYNEEELVEESPPGWIRERFEDVVHGVRLCD